MMRGRSLTSRNLLRLDEPIWSVYDIDADEILASGLTHDQAFLLLDEAIDAGRGRVTITRDIKRPNGH